MSATWDHVYPKLVCEVGALYTGVTLGYTLCEGASMQESLSIEANSDYGRPCPAIDPDIAHRFRLQIRAQHIDLHGVGCGWPWCGGMARCLGGHVFSSCAKGLASHEGAGVSV